MADIRQSFARQRIGNVPLASFNQGRGIAQADTSGLLKKRFAGLRTQQQLGFQRAGEQQKENIERFAAQTGVGSGSGALLKLQQTGEEELARGRAEAEAGLGAEEAAQLAAAQESKLARKEGSRQFNQAMNLQRFVAQNEMDLSRFATTINAITALKQGGPKSLGDWKNIFQAEKSLGFEFAGPTRSQNYYGPGQDTKDVG